VSVPRGPQFGATGVRAVGAVVAVASIGLLLAYPYHMAYHYSGAVGHYDWVALAEFLQFAWAVAAAWAVATLFSGRLRSLTPARASLAVALAPVPYVLDAFRRPTTDVVPAPPRIAEWTPPSGFVDLAARTLSSVGFWRLGAVLFLVLGVAAARGQRRWLHGTVVALVAYGGAHGAATTNVLHGMVFRPLVAAPLGAVLYVLGLKLAADAENGAAT